MTQPTEINHPARLLFELLLREFRSVVQHEFAMMRQDLKESTGTRPIPSSAKRFYSIKEAAVELNISEPTVRRLINRGLLHPNRAIRHIRIPREQLDEFAHMTLLHQRTKGF